MITKKEITSPQAFEYIRGQLISKKTLSNFLSQQDIESGKVYTFVPENISEAQLYNFGIGGLYPSEKKRVNSGWLSKIINEAKPRVNDLIRDYLDSNPRNCCIFEECNAEPDNPWVINSKIEYVHIKDEMYYFFDKEENNNKEKFEEAFNRSGGWYFLCVLSSLDLMLHNDFSPFSEISPTLMKHIANKTTVFFVEAYDHEGYLMWTR